MAHIHEKKAVYRACHKTFGEPMTEDTTAAVEAEMPRLLRELLSLPNLRHWQEQDKNRWRSAVAKARRRWRTSKRQKEMDSEEIRKAAHIELDKMTPGDFRAELARYGVAEWDAARRIKVTVSHLSKVLHEKVRMSAKVRDGLGHIIAEEIRKKKRAKHERRKPRQEGGSQTRRRMRGDEDA